jgi:hypothetical protein
MDKNRKEKRSKAFFYDAWGLNQIHCSQNTFRIWILKELLKSLW